jgi:hypothetical protein
MNAWRLGSAAALVWLVLPAGAACPPQPQDGAVLSAGAVTAAWRAEPERIAVGQPFELRVQLCPNSLRLQRVDAQMPEHRHGMNYRPSVTALGDGQWRVQGMLWHMAGRWELRLDVVDAADVTSTLRQSVVLR